MITTNDLEKLLLVVPGMEDVVKFSGTPKRKTVLVMSSLIDRALSVKGEGNELFSNLPEEVVKDVVAFMEDLLDKGGLAGIRAQMKQLSAKK